LTVTGSNTGVSIGCGAGVGISHSSSRISAATSAACFPKLFFFGGLAGEARGVELRALGNQKRAELGHQLPHAGRDLLDGRALHVAEAPAAAFDRLQRKAAQPLRAAVSRAVFSRAN